MGCCQTQSISASHEISGVQDPSSVMIPNRSARESFAQVQVDEPSSKEQYMELATSERQVKLSIHSPNYHSPHRSAVVPKSPSRPVSKFTSFQSICVPDFTNETDYFNVQRKAFVRQNFTAIRYHYDIRHMIGQGGFGKVYQVVHKKTQMVRALKILSKDKLDQVKLLEEMNILTQMDHPNIVKLYEVYEDDDSFYLVNEYCSGGEMLERLRKQRKLSEHNISIAMKQILSAITYCHKMNIVHRDIKPENIMFDSMEPDARVKLIDFGASAKLDSTCPLRKRIGTPFYVAPEVLAANYTEKCDIWSIGVMLYLFLCGYPPFIGANEGDILRKVKKGQYSMAPRDWKNISPLARDLVQKMLVVDPACRLSALEAYNHPWIQTNNIRDPIDQEVIKKLGEFELKNMLKRVILEYISVQDNLIKEFNSIDLNGDGMLSKHELYRVYVQLFRGNKIRAHHTVDELFPKLDIDRSGKVDYSEFVAAALETESKLSEERLEQAFALFDLDENGYITKAEIQELFGGIDIKQELWDDILQECDNDRDGMISKAEFVQLLKQKISEHP